MSPYEADVYEQIDNENAIHVEEVSACPIPQKIQLRCVLCKSLSDFSSGYSNEGRNFLCPKCTKVLADFMGTSRDDFVKRYVHTDKPIWYQITQLFENPLIRY